MQKRMTAVGDSLGWDFSWEDCPKFPAIKRGCSQGPNTFCPFTVDPMKVQNVGPLEKRKCDDYFPTGEQGLGRLQGIKKTAL